MELSGSFGRTRAFPRSTKCFDQEAKILAVLPTEFCPKLTSLMSRLVMKYSQDAATRPGVFFKNPGMLFLFHRDMLIK